MPFEVNPVDMSHDSLLNSAPSHILIQSKQPGIKNSFPCTLKKKITIQPKEKCYVNLYSACDIQSDKFLFYPASQKF